jgi:hypothetical protein
MRIETERIQDSIRYAGLDSLYKARAVNDSIEKVRRDSIRIETERKEKYEARPWKLSYYSDEFGDPTNKKFIKFTGYGYFSNSATSRDDLFVKVNCDKNSVGIFLHQYNWNSSAESPIGSWRVLMKNSKGETLELTINSKWNNSGGGSMSTYKYGDKKSDVEKFIWFCKKSVGDISVVVKNEYSSTWSFKMSVDGFTKEYSLL